MVRAVRSERRAWQSKVRRTRPRDGTETDLAKPGDFPKASDLRKACETNPRTRADDQSVGRSVRPSCCHLANTYLVGASVLVFLRSQGTRGVWRLVNTAGSMSAADVDLLFVGLMSVSGSLEDEGVSG